MKTTIEMPDELFRRAKAAALARGQTLKQLISTALERELVQPAPAQETFEQREAQAEAFARELEALAQKISVTWKSDKSALEQLSEDRNARCY